MLRMSLALRNTKKKFGRVWYINQLKQEARKGQAAVSNKAPDLAHARILFCRIDRYSLHYMPIMKQQGLLSWEVLVEKAKGF